MKTLKEVEQMIGIHADTLRQKINRKTLKGRKIGRDWVISEKEVQRICPHEHVSSPGDISTLKCVYCGASLSRPIKGQE